MLATLATLLDSPGGILCTFLRQQPPHPFLSQEDIVLRRSLRTSFQESGPFSCPAAHTGDPNRPPPSYLSSTQVGETVMPYSAATCERRLAKLSLSLPISSFLIRANSAVLCVGFSISRAALICSLICDSISGQSGSSRCSASFAIWYHCFVLPGQR